MSQRVGDNAGGGRNALYKDTRAGRAVGEQRQLKKQRTGAQDTVTAAPIPIWDASKILEPEMQAAEPQARSSSTTPVLKGFTFKPTASSNTQRNGFSPAAAFSQPAAFP